MTDKIIIKGAKEHNLKDINVEIPKNKLVVITGVSGSGKSSLAFDTIYAEGQRRYVESLSSYARQFLGIMEKPDIEYIDGLSPAISIDQKTTSHNPRSTVGTTTEIYDYMRLLWAKIGVPHCPICQTKITSQTIEEISNEILKIKDKKIQILSPIVRSKKGEYKELIENFIKRGFSRIRIDGKIYSLEDDEIKLSKFKIHNIEIIIDRIVIDSNLSDTKDITSRVNEAVESAVKLSGGEVIVNTVEEGKDKLFSETLSCPNCHISIPTIQPNTFSFNSPYGACPKCNGLGTLKIIDEKTTYNPNLTILEGGIYPLSNDINNIQNSWIIKILQEVSKKHNIPLNIPIGKYKKEELNLLFNGTGEEKYQIVYKPKMRGPRKYNVTFHGITEYLMEKYNNGSDFVKREIEEYIKEMKCPECGGDKLNNVAKSIKIDDKNIIEISKYSIDKLYSWVINVSTKLKDEEKFIAKQILLEIEHRLKFLIDVGVGYLSIERQSRTLAGGEAQRIRLASQIGSRLSGVLYILDEPSIGLHQRDNNKLIQTLKSLRDIGNSVIVVEHDKEMIENADWIIDMGKGAGIHGGSVIAQGKLDDIKKEKESITGKYLNEEIKIELPKKRRDINKYLEIIGASEHNLKNINVKIPIETFTVVTGVSGSGKSTLINDILYPYISNVISQTRKFIGKVERINGIENINKVIEIDQSPIGKTPRSNPATYTGIFTIIRELFSMTPEAKAKGYKSGRFSFNIKGGRCEHCKGDGIIKIEMQFLPDVYVTCEVCKGKRYNQEALSILYKGKNISEVLDMTVDQAVEFFKNIYAIKSKLATLVDVGLGYIKLGQSATTFSGGESQRIKLATELARKATGKTLYILDEPTTGLHFDDINKLLRLLEKLVDQKNTVVVIEHNLDVIKMGDWIIDLGKEGGDEGGQIIFEGRVEDIINCKDSYTGKFVKDYL